MNKKAVIIQNGKKYSIACDVDFLPEFFGYLLEDSKNPNEIKLIFGQVFEGHRTRKYSQEPYGTMAFKPFLNTRNDRIICKIVKRGSRRKSCIVMSELFRSKKSDNVDRRLNTRYKLVSRINYEIIESD